jgi:hypothetical protein
MEQQTVMAVNHSITQAGLHENFNLQLARGQIHSHRHVFKYGYNAAVGTTAETIWLQGAAYTWPAAAATLEVTSSSTDDDGDPAGTGALTVTLQGLDANYDEIEETVTMDGQTAVTTTASFLRCHRMFVATAGSGLTNAGTIYAANSSGTHTAGVPGDLTLVYSTIGIAEGQTLQAFYTIPAGYTAYVTNVSAGSQDGTNATTMSFRQRPVGGAFRTAEKFIVFKGSFDRPHEIPLSFAEKTDLELLGTAANSTTDVAGNFDLILVKN